MRVGIGNIPAHIETKVAKEPEKEELKVAEEELKVANEIIQKVEGGVPERPAATVAAPEEEDIAEEVPEEEAPEEEPAPAAAPQQTQQSGVVFKYTLSFLKNSMKFNDKVIEEYFYKNGDKYSLKPDCGYRDAYQLKTGLYQDYQNMLILNNFLSGNVTDKYGHETANALKSTSDNKVLSMSNFMKYADEIGEATPEEAEAMRKEALDKLIGLFTNGDLAFAQVRTILNAIGVTNIKQSVKNKNYVFKFKFDGKDYEITCNTKAARSGLDDIKNNITSEGKKEVLKKVRASLEDGSFAGAPVPPEEADEMMNALAACPGLESFVGGKEDFLKMVKAILGTIYAQFLDTGVIQSTPVGSILEEVGILDFVNDLLNSGEFDAEVTQEQAMAIIDRIADKIKDAIKDRVSGTDVDKIVNVVLDHLFGSPSNLITNVIDVIKKMSNNEEPDKYNLQTILRQFLTDTDSLLNAMELSIKFPDLTCISDIIEGDVNSFCSKILDAVTANFDYPQVHILSNVIRSLVEERTVHTGDIQDFVDLVVNYIIEHGNSNVATILAFIMTELRKLDADGDGNWINDLVGKVKDIIDLFKSLS